MKNSNLIIILFIISFAGIISCDKCQDKGDTKVPSGSVIVLDLYKDSVSPQPFFNNPYPGYSIDSLKLSHSKYGLICNNQCALSIIMSFIGQEIDVFKTDTLFLYFNQTDSDTLLLKYFLETDRCKRDFIRYLSILYNNKEVYDFTGQNYEMNETIRIIK